MIVAAWDAYDEAVAWLTERPEEIWNAWMEGNGPAIGRGCLFRYACKSGEFDGQDVGCLTAIRSGTGHATTRELTRAIRLDDRLPRNSQLEAGVANLPVFAEWQRHLDSVLGRPAPVWNYESEAPA